MPSSTRGSLFKGKWKSAEGPETAENRGTPGIPANQKPVTPRLLAFLMKAADESMKEGTP